MEADRVTTAAAAASSGEGGDDDGFYPVVSSELVASGDGETFDEHDAAVTFTPVQLTHQEALLRAGNFTLVTPDGAVVHHGPLEKSEASFCVQAISASFASAADLAKASGSHHEPAQFLVSDLATYQLSAGGDVYKLVVREEKESAADDEDAVADPAALQQYSQVELTAESLSDGGVASPVPETAEAAARPATSPPAPALAPQTLSVTAPPPQHCLVCGLALVTHRALGIFGNSTHQSKTTYALKLRQVTGHDADFSYHSEVICESCASLLNVVDSFEARLREITNRLENTRYEVSRKFERTRERYCSSADAPDAADESASGLVVTCVASMKSDTQEPHTRKPRKRRSSDEAAAQPPMKKKPRGKTAPAEKDADYPDRGKPAKPLDEESLARRRPVRKVVAERLPAVEEESDADDPAPSEPTAAEEGGPESSDAETPAKADRAVSALSDEDADHLVSQGNAAEEREDPGAEEEEDGEEEQLLPEVSGTDTRPVRIANMCPDCGRLFINPMVLRVHQLSHQRPMPPPLPPPPTAADFIPIIDMDNYVVGTDDVLAQAVQQMNRAESPPPPALPPPPLQPKPDLASLPTEVTKRAGSGGAPAAVREVYKCDSCPSLFRTVQGLQKHHRKEHSQSVWRCFVCWQAVGSSRRLRRHVATHAEKNACAVCLQPFDTKMLLKLHVTRKHPETQTKNNFCELCRKHFDNNGFLEHARHVHGVDSDGTRQFKCAQCDKVLGNGACYLRHMKTHKKDFKCQYCEKSFNTRTNLNNHERTHTGEKPFVCPDCERCFVSKQVRDTHVRTFHQQNPYACKRCNRRCESKAAFIRHMRSHAGVTPYECPVCCKKVTTEYSLKMHIRAVHDRKMPFKCDVCDKAFPYKSSLTLHLNTHAGGKSHICDVCGKCFASRGSLRTHMHTHSTDKPYKCEWCDRSFSRKDLLAGHRLQVHGIQPEMNYSRLSNKR